jgi:WD40 repeat protein
MRKTILLCAVAAWVMVGCTVNNPPHPTIDSIPPPTGSITPFPSKTLPSTATPVPIVASMDTPAMPPPTTTPVPGPTATPFGGFTAQFVIVQKFKEMDLYLYSLDGYELKNLTRDLQGDKLFMGWSPDGKAILVGEYDAKKRLSFSKMKIWLVDIDSESRKELIESNGTSSYDWSPDGKWIQVECYNGKICLIDTATFEVVQSRFFGNTVGFSPDSRWLSWDNFPTQLRRGGSLPLKQTVHYGTLYAWAGGAANLTQVLSYSSYLGTTGTQWAKDSQSLYILDIVNGKSALTQVMLDSRSLKHLYQFEKEICATDLSPDGKIFLLRARVVAGEAASCTGALGLANLENGKLLWYEDLQDIKWVRWTGDHKALVVLLNDGHELMIDLATGATSPTDWMNWTKFFELWALQRVGG